MYSMAHFKVGHTVHILDIFLIKNVQKYDTENQLSFFDL